MNKTLNTSELEAIQNGTATLNLGKGVAVIVQPEAITSRNLSDAFKAIEGSHKISSIQTLTDLDGTVDKRFFFEGSGVFIQVIYDEDDLSHLRRNLKLWAKVDIQPITSDSQQEESIRNLLATEITMLGHTYERVNREAQFEFLTVEPSTSKPAVEHQYNSFERYINDEYDVEQLRCEIDTSDQVGKITYWVGVDIEPECLVISQI